MGYCTVADVASEFKSIAFTSSSLVTDAAVNSMIDEASALIDSKIGTRYQVPLSDTISLNLVRLFAKTLVAERVRGILGVKQSTNTDANQNEKGVGFKSSDVMSALQDIMNGVMPLNGATLLLSNAGFESNNYQSGVQAHFHKDRKQW